jgi:hypothetical protein
MKVGTMHNYIVRVPYYNLAIPFDKVSLIQCIGKGWGPLLIVSNYLKNVKYTNFLANVF